MQVILEQVDNSLPILWGWAKFLPYQQPWAFSRADCFLPVIKKGVYFLHRTSASSGTSEQSSTVEGLMLNVIDKDKVH